MGVKLYSLLLVIQLTSINSAIPRVYTKCRAWDSGCLTRQAQIKVSALVAGIPELGTETLDPMIIDFARINTAGLKMDIHKAVLGGLRNAVIDKINIDTVSRQIQIVYHTDISLRARYNADGRILSLPFNGEGVAQMFAKNLRVEFLIPFGITKDGFGRDVIDLKGFQYWFDVKDNVRFDNTNLFYGNKVQSASTQQYRIDTFESASTQQYLNANWKVISMIYGRPLLDVMNTKIFNSIRSYLLSQPINDILLF